MTDTLIKSKGYRVKGGRWVMALVGGSGGRKIETIVLEQQFF